MRAMVISRCRREPGPSSFKGAALPLETMTFMVLAIIVLAALLFLFSGNVPPAGDKVAKERERAIACSAYTQKDPECSIDLGSPASTSEVNDARNRVAVACKALRALEGGYSDCTGTASLACVWQCCSTYCRGTASCREIGGTCEANCPAGKREIQSSSPSCQTSSTTGGYKCCK
ncbi:MAG: hypothetical protein HYY37_02335 [Candidatus Aenigmarchaeota archaeon]|nr:hypothetical protein [Candidatus Aenigmarchaeota archaeon]